MKRVTLAADGKVHFAGADCRRTLCGGCVETLFGGLDKLVETGMPVTCPACAKLYCQIKNAPWNELDRDVLEKAVYKAVEKEDGGEQEADLPVQEED